MAIDVKEAVKLAFKYAEELLKAHQKTPNLRLEEVIFDNEAKQWSITLGYDTADFIETKIENSFVPEKKIKKERKRDYKTFLFDANEGVFSGMKHYKF